MAELFAEVMGEAAAELSPVEPAELTGAEETSQAIWDVPAQERAAQVAAESPEEASAADEAASVGVEALFELEELAVESSPLQELSQLPDFGAAPDSGPEADLWAEEPSPSLQPGDGEAAADLWAEFPADIWPGDFSVPDETGSLTSLDSAAEGGLESLVSAADQAWWSPEEAGEPSPLSRWLLNPLLTLPTLPQSSNWKTFSPKNLRPANLPLRRRASWPLPTSRRRRKPRTWGPS